MRLSMASDSIQFVFLKIARIFLRHIRVQSKKGARKLRLREDRRNQRVACCFSMEQVQSRCRLKRNNFDGTHC